MVHKSNVRLTAANMLLERGVRFTISGAPWYLRLFRLNRVGIHPLKGGTIMEISRLLDESGLSDIRMPRDVNERLDILSLIIAIAVLNGFWQIKLFSKVYSKLLLWTLPGESLREIAAHIRKVDRLTDFMITTGYFGIQAEMMMSPRFPGQVKGS